MKDIELNPALISALMHSPTGPVGIYIKRLGGRVLADAKRQVPVRSGALRNSLYMELLADGGVAIVANTAYARSIHEGHPAYVRKGIQAFPASRGRPRIIVTNKTNQPASRPNPYLVRALVEAIRSI